MRKCYLAGVTALATLLGAHSSTIAENDTSHFGQMMWSAFKCTTYAELAGDQGEQVRLFALGYSAGNKLLEKMDQEGAATLGLSRIPAAVALRLYGPSVDFIVGRIFEGAATCSFDEVVNAEATHQDNRMNQIIGERNIRDNNCTLLRCTIHAVDRYF